MTTTPAPVFPPGRYGRRREPRRGRRWLTFVLLIPVLLAGLWLSLRLYHQYGDTAYESTVSGFTVINDHQVDVQLDVTRGDDRAAVCRVQAKDRSAAEVGYAEVTVPAGTGSQVRVSYRLETTARPFAVDVLGCHAA